MIPEWFIPICHNPNQVVQKFEEFFSRSKSSSNIDDLYFLFGAINFERIQSFLPKSLQKKMTQRSGEIERRFLIIWKTFLIPLQNQTAINSILMQQVCPYEHSAYGGENPRDLLLNELSRYLISRSMPVQISRNFDCYKIVYLKKEVNSYAKKLQEVVSLLFRLGVRRIDPSFLSLTFEEQFIMFKSAAFKFEKQQYSWGKLVYLWAKTKGNTMVESTIKNSFCLDKLLIKEDESFIWNPPNDSSLSFKQYVIESTLYLFFNSPQAPLPDVELIRKDLEQAFSSPGTDEDRKNCIYYVDQLFLWFQTTNQEFSFALALKILDALEVSNGKKGVVYRFLHAVAHYYHALRNLKVEEKIDCKKIILEAVYAVPNTQRSFFDQILEGERYSRPPFLVDDYFVSFIQDHSVSLEKWGEMILRFSHTRCADGDNPYLSSRDHLVLIEKIEALIGASLPESIIEDILFFQTIKKHAFEVVNRFESFRTMIFEKYLEEVNVPADLYKEWQNLLQDFMDQFDYPTLIFEENNKTYKERSEQFLQVAFCLARILQTIVFPKPVIFFTDLIPESIRIVKEDELRIVMSEKGSNSIQRLQLFEPNFPSGPLWMASWQCQGGDIYFTVSIINSLENMRTCSFSLKLPLDELNDLSVLKTLVDGQENSNKFVGLLHSSFLKSFYLVLLETKAPEAVITPGSTNLYPLENDFYLKKPVPNKPINEKNIVRFSDYDQSLEQIYVNWKESLVNKYVKEAVFQLKIGTQTTLQAPLDLTIVTENFVEEEGHQGALAWDIVHITWTLTVDDVTYDSTLKYPPFEDKEVFVRTMIWQLALLKQEYLKRE